MAGTLTLANIPQEDEDVYDMICRADTMGVFQIESRAQMSMLPRLQAEVLLRPGDRSGHRPARADSGEHGSSVLAAARRRGRGDLSQRRDQSGAEKDARRAAVSRTGDATGRVAAGFTPGEADQLRRAMAAWRRPGLIGRIPRKLIEGMLEKGLTPEFAERVFQQIKGFGEYGFPEVAPPASDPGVFSAWLKFHYPGRVLRHLNSQAMGFTHLPSSFAMLERMASKSARSM